LGLDATRGSTRLRLWRRTGQRRKRDDEHQEADSGGDNPGRRTDDHDKFAPPLRGTKGTGEPALDPVHLGTHRSVMSRRRKRLIAVLAGGVLLLAAAAFRLSPLWPGPTLPPGATQLHITTAAPHLVPTFACNTAALAPARIATLGDELILLSETDDEPVKVVWPSGWAAWRVDGRAELVTRDGSVVAREGDVIDGFGGGIGLDDAFHVCIVGS
jgi:hypothetical protein